MRRERASARGENLRFRALDCRCIQRAVVGGQHHLRGHDRANDWILSPRYQRHPNAGMAIDHRLYFFRVDLQSPDIDDSTAPSDEIAPIATLLDDIIASC